MGASVIAEKITKLLINNKIEIASIQRDIVWNENKIKKFCEQLLEKPLFLSSIYSKEEDEKPIIYDGLQRISTLLIILNLMWEKDTNKITNDVDFERVSKLYFHNEKRQFEWDNVISQIKNNESEISNSQVYKNYKIIEKFYNDLDTKDKEIFIKNFK